MPAPWILQGDARTIPLRDGSVDAVLTSPPYNLGKAYPNDAWPEHAAYVAFLRACYAECRRVARGPVCWVLPLMLHGRFVYAEVGDWAWATPVIAATESAVMPGRRGWLRAYIGIELLLATAKPPPGCWVVFAPQPFIGADERNRPRSHPAPFVREVVAAAMAMFPDARLWLDPFGGSGTTALVGRGLGRDVVTMDLWRPFVELQRKQLGQGVLLTPGDDGRGGDRMAKSKKRPKRKGSGVKPTTAGPGTGAAPAGPTGAPAQ
mgnify:CR=1 FL=1